MKEQRTIFQYFVIVFLNSGTERGCVVIIENVLIVAAISKYTWKKIKKKGNILALFLLFQGLWGLLLSLFHFPGPSITNYTSLQEVILHAYNEKNKPDCME